MAVYKEQYPRYGSAAVEFMIPDYLYMFEKKKYLYMTVLCVK